MSIILEKYVAYYRVSTKRQGRSGLGLEAQQKAVRDMAARFGATIIAEYVEVETGKRADRPKLLEAIRHACLTNSTLVVAKLDRLARNAYFTRTLKESKQRFVCCDNPNASDLTIDILAVIEEAEEASVYDYNFHDGELRLDESRNSSEYDIKGAAARLFRKATPQQLVPVLKPSIRFGRGCNRST